MNTVDRKQLIRPLSFPIATVKSKILDIIRFTNMVAIILTNPHSIANVTIYRGLITKL